MKSNQKQELLIVFTRYPEPGKVKTRLAGVVGNKGSADIQKKLTEHTMASVQQLLRVHPVQVHVYFTGGDLQQMRAWLGEHFHLLPQGNGDLGTRLTMACANGFRQGFKRLVVIGSDCPGLAASHITEAFTALYEKDMVLGPATDGGYYLIGMRRENSQLFSGIPWGSDAVLSSTIKVANDLGLTITTLDTLSDVDRPEDLKHINNHPGS